MRRLGSLLSWIWYSLLPTFHRSDPAIVSGHSLQSFVQTARQSSHLKFMLTNMNVLLILFVTHTHFNVLYINITLSCLFLFTTDQILYTDYSRWSWFVNFMLIRGSPSFNDTPVWNILSPGPNIGASTNRYSWLVVFHWRPSYGKVINKALTSRRGGGTLGWGLGWPVMIPG